MRPAPDEPAEPASRPGRSRTSCSPASARRSSYLDSLGWDAIVAHERALGERFLEGLPERVSCRDPGDGGPRADLSFTLEGRRPSEVARHLGERGFVVWHGDYYAVETMERLGLPDGAVRVGIVHYNTAERGRPAAGGALRALMCVS